MKESPAIDARLYLAMISSAPLPSWSILPPPPPPPVGTMAPLPAAVRHEPQRHIAQTEAPIAPLTQAEIGQLQQLVARQPGLLGNLSRNTIGTPETPTQRAAMFLRVGQHLPPTQQQALTELLSNGRLVDVQGDDRHSTLFHLYGILTTPRAAGLDARITLAETVQYLARPDDNEQDFTELSPDNKRQMLTLLEHPVLDEHQTQGPLRPVDPDALDITNTNTCAPAAQMSRLASQSPKEFARHINEATSLAGIIYEKASPYQINPSDPGMADRILDHFNLTYHPLASGDRLVELPVPRLGLLRAINAQQHPDPGKGSGIETLYQTTILYNGARKNYDPATDTRDALDLGQVAINNSKSLTAQQKEQLFQIFDKEPNATGVREQVKQKLEQWQAGTPEDREAINNALAQTTVGLTEDERTLMERIVEDGEPIRSVTYQINGAPPQIDRNNEGSLYLYGYTRTFDQMAGDLVRGLQSGRQLIAGITYSDGGEMVGGHVFKIDDYFVDPQDQQLKFHITDSDDGAKGPVTVAARELIPQLHHIGLPDSIARDLWADIDSRPNEFYRPDASDASAYDVIDVLPEQPPAGTFLPGQYLSLVAQQEAYEKEQKAVADPLQIPALPDSPTQAGQKLALQA